ncbi:Aminoglycoside phosphotransferase [Fusarium austroafricanum]|uniref:Aminoglycoside phosphotransferase n=1 Tax=Fusarium austroafricanum TaxID=2364996 RepID=A0A8H4JQN9_9HYPO|nr:Aminoglycoside phosphotransferase [Fusarium austroafricanum]
MCVSLSLPPPPLMEDTLPLLRGRISLDDAMKEDIDIIRELSYYEKRDQFWIHLYTQRQQIIEVVSQHLNIQQSDFSLGEVKEWIHGSFNACIPVHILQSPRTSDLPTRVIIRFPLPYKVGEAFCHGNIDEKLRSEAATRALWLVRRAVSWIYGRALVPYVPHSRYHLVDFGYLILEYIEDGKMLSDTWKEYRHDSKRRANLFRDLSRIMLSLAKLPFPRIGSWTIDDCGVLKLANRPLTLLLHQLENAEIGTGIPRDRTYTSIEPYLLDLIACHDNRLRHQPNSIHHQNDGEQQLAALTAMRALLPKFMDSRFREGPFVYSLTDLHQSNVFVDQDWHITGLIDLEWACSRPIGMLGPPDWLSDRSLEEITFHFNDYSSLHDEFVDSVEREGLELYHTNFSAEVMRASWETGSFWYCRALDSPTTLLALYIDHLQPRFAKLSTNAWAEFSHLLMALWDVNSRCFVSSKIKEQEQYANQVREIFSKSLNGESNPEAR